MTASGANFSLDISFGTAPPTVTVIGPIDLLTTPILAGALNGLIADGQPLIVLDVGRVTLIDRLSAQAIAEASSRARNAGTSINVRSASALTRRILDLADTSRCLAIETADAHRGEAAPSADDDVRHRASAHMAPAFPRAAIDRVDASLQLVASLTDATVTHNAGVSVTLERDGTLTTVAASTDRAIAVDHHQYETGQGPCLDAKTQGQRFYLESMSEETRWPAFVPLAMQHGIGSILSSPLRTHNRPQGSLNVYSTDERAFDVNAQQLAALFARQASHILTADQDPPNQHWHERFTAALGARRAIHQAQGVLMARHGIAANDALTRIMRIARTRQMTTLAYASEIVDTPHGPGHSESDGAGT